MELSPQLQELSGISSQQGRRKISRGCCNWCSFARNRRTTRPTYAPWARTTLCWRAGPRGSRPIAPNLAAWFERERESCSYFAAVALDRRISHSSDLLSQQIADRLYFESAAAARPLSYRLLPFDRATGPACKSQAASDVNAIRTIRAGDDPEIRNAARGKPRGVAFQERADSVALLRLLNTLKIELGIALFVGAQPLAARSGIRRRRAVSAQTRGVPCTEFVGAKKDVLRKASGMAGTWRMRGDGSDGNFSIGSLRTGKQRAWRWHMRRTIRPRRCWRRGSAERGRRPRGIFPVAGPIVRRC